MDECDYGSFHLAKHLTHLQFAMPLSHSIVGTFFLLRAYADILADMMIRSGSNRLERLALALTKERLCGRVCRHKRANRTGVSGSLCRDLRPAETTHYVGTTSHNLLYAIVKYHYTPCVFIRAEDFELERFALTLTKERSGG